jgi:ElaB/YqjD/DUF883 family membrane-anchored ribosome-binding protein
MGSGILAGMTAISGDIYWDFSRRTYDLMKNRENGSDQSKNEGETMSSITSENTKQSTSIGRSVERSERESPSGNTNREMTEGSRSSVKRLKDQAIVVGEDIQELAHTAGAAAREQLDPVDEYVRRQPLKSLLIAAAAGAVFGMLFRRH